MILRKQRTAHYVGVASKCAGVGMAKLIALEGAEFFFDLTIETKCVCVCAVCKIVFGLTGNHT